MDYLANRGFGDDTIAKFRLGYAPNNNGLKALLASKGISEAEMQELGLIAVPEDKNRRSHDFFPRPGNYSDYGQAGTGNRFRRPHYGRRTAEVSELAGNPGF